MTLIPPTAYPNNGAWISDDGVYRYRLWREWDLAQPACAFIMLNPSTADAEQDDPTVRRCIRYAKDWGYGRLLVGNLFALRSTDPGLLYQTADPIGPANDRALMAMHEEAEITVCAWGTHGEHMRRGLRVTEFLAARKPLHCLSTTKEGHPGHPLYLPKSATPFPYASWRQ